MSPSLRAIVAACFIAVISAERAKKGDQVMEVDFDQDHEEEAKEEVYRGETVCCWTLAAATNLTDAKWDDGKAIGGLTGNDKGCNVITDSTDDSGVDPCTNNAQAKTLKLMYEVELVKPKAEAEVKKAEAVNNNSIKGAQAKNTKAIADSTKSQQLAYVAKLKKYDEEQVKKRQEEDDKYKKEKDNATQIDHEKLEKELKIETDKIDDTFKKAKADAEKEITAKEDKMDKKFAEDYEKKKKLCEGNKNCCCKVMKKGTAFKVPGTYNFDACDKVVPYVDAWTKASSCNFYSDCEQCTKKMCKDGNCHTEEEPEAKKGFFR